MPKSLFPLILAKLDEFSSSKSYKSEWLSSWGAKRTLQGFPSRRCTKEFISLYIEHHPDLLDRVSEPGLFLDSVPEVRLAQRLHEFGLLPEDKRRRFIETVSTFLFAGVAAAAALAVCVLFMPETAPASDVSSGRPEAQITVSE